ncbi:hypothetical protein V1527DRAFT_57276 [Lipomyces starkeyi]
MIFHNRIWLFVLTAILTLSVLHVRSYHLGAVSRCPRSMMVLLTILGFIALSNHTSLHRRNFYLSDFLEESDRLPLWRRLRNNTKQYLQGFRYGVGKIRTESACM